jgi:cell division protein FtsQ
MAKVRTGAKRPRKAALRVFLTLFKVILISVFVIYSFYYFSQSSFFALQKIEVRGQQHLAPAEVASQSGLSDGANIFQLNLDQARERLLADPWIAGATLRRQLPNKVEIDIVERQPSALLIAGQYWLVLDRNGVCIDSLTSTRLYSLPIITGLAPVTVEPGRQVSASPVLPVVLAALDLSVEDFFSEVDVADPESLIAYTRDGIPIYLGDSQNLHSKLLTAQSLMASLNDPSSVAYIDLRSAQAPAVQYKSPASPGG